MTRLDRKSDSQANADAPVSAQSGASFAVSRAASATRKPATAKRRANDALKPGPAPTISAVR